MAEDETLPAQAEASLRRLVRLAERGELTIEQLRLAAGHVGVSERTMRRRLDKARVEGAYGRRQRQRFEIDTELRRRLAFHRGNAAALHRELVAEAKTAGRRPPSLATVERAIRRDLSPGDRAGLAKGERERRKYDVFGTRPASELYRNAVWESDHMEAPVEVDVEGRLVKPWVTWFVDAAYKVVCGSAITPGRPSREAVLAALRAAVLRVEPYGPVGGVPRLVRVDQGKEFLCRTVGSALGAFGVRLLPVKAYEPWLKGSVEMVNGAAQSMLFAQMPRYTKAQRLATGKPADANQPALTYEAFVAEVLAWTAWWNDHPIAELGGRAPLQAWSADPTPVEEIPATDLWLFTLEDDGKVRRITTKGVQWGSRHYCGVEEQRYSH